MNFKEQGNLIEEFEDSEAYVRIIVIDTDRISKPHFHYQRMDHKTNKEVFVTWILLEEAEYMSHKNKAAQKLKEEWLNKLVRSLNQLHPKYKVPIWEYMVDIWNGGIGNVTVKDDVVYPDYTALVTE
ncbi:MAG: hypothetical protein FWG09_04680 [Synergistaceae bacterium]|nr:hypothetical protein [Synergistaceae bacterium]